MKADDLIAACDKATPEQKQTLPPVRNKTREEVLAAPRQYDRYQTLHCTITGR